MQLVKKYKILMLCTILFSAAVALLIVLQFVFPALSVGEKISGVNFEYKQYSGFDVAIFCWPKFILGYQLIGPNPLLIAALLVPILATLICGLMWKNAGFTKRIVLSAIMAVSYLFFAVCFLSVKDLVMLSALDRFRELAAAAVKKDMYRIGGYAIVACIAAVVGAALHCVAIVENVRMIRSTGVEVLVSEE